ncbi:MAG: MMPL family transporter [Flavobacteriales bacterium]|nr:MMPL family transporter [Flavobacteriales bacterium]
MIPPAPRPLVDRIERTLTPRNARLIIAVLAGITLVFAAALRLVRLDYDFERFFPTGDPELERYLDFRERFGDDNEFLLVGLEGSPHVFTTAFLGRVDSLTGALEALPDVRRVDSPTRMTEPRVTPAGVFQVPWLRWHEDSLLQADSARVLRDARMRDLFATEGDALLLVVHTAPGLSKVKSDSLLLRIEHVLATQGFADAPLAGRIHGQYHYIEKMKVELAVFFSSSVVMLSLFLWIAFRRSWAVAVPIGVVALTVLWQVGLMTLLGKPLTVLTMLLPTILFVVGMSDVVHILERYLEGLRNGLPRIRALAVTLHEVGLATFLTSLTTGIGFATLLTSRIQPIREFGIYTAIGVLLAYAIAFTLLPAILVLLPVERSMPAHGQGDRWTPWLQGLFRWTLRHRRHIVWGFSGLTVLAALLATRIKVDNFLLEDWADDDPHRMAFVWFEDHFGGVRPFEMEVTADAPLKVSSPQVLWAMERMQDYLRDGYGVGRLTSPVTVLQAVNKAMNGGAEGFDRLPTDSIELKRLWRNAQATLGGEVWARLVDEEQRYARISGSMRDQGGYVHRGLNAELADFIVQEQAPGIHYRQTGMAFLIDLNNETLSAQLLKGLSIAFLLIAAILAWVFRDLRMTLVALIPNVIPLILVAGIMGATGIDLKVSTSIIFTIAFGIAVDDTIHLLGKLRIERSKSRGLALATRRSMLSAGKAVIITSLMLYAGFATLVLSNFASVYYMGLLVGLTLVFALLTDLTLLPLLVLGLLRRKRRR